jgi:3-hydroxyisobutyrate dehydrogenase-like beta-hydroxyacid dehydrogenase
MLSDDAAIREVLIDSGALSMGRPGLTHVVTATISVSFAEELTVLHEAARLGYVAAPVLGRPDVAARGELNILTAGRPESVGVVRPLLDILGKKVWDMGEVPKRANAAKVAANMMIAMAIEAMTEALAITELMAFRVKHSSISSSIRCLVVALIKPIAPTLRNEGSSPVSKPAWVSRICGSRRPQRRRGEASCRCSKRCAAR